MTHLHSPETPAQTEGRLIPWAAHYDLVTKLLTFGQVGRLRLLTVELAQLQPGESALDVGCGTGGVTIPARQRVGPSGKAAGIDPSPEMIAIARDKAHRKGLEIDFRMGVIEALPFPDASFDAVTSSLMMHHLPGDLKARGLAEVYRVLKPGGRMLVADMSRSPGSRHGFNPMALLHHDLAFGVEDLHEPASSAGFGEVTLLKPRFFVIGFLRLVKM